MKSNQTAVNILIVSLLIGLVGLALAFSRVGLKLAGGSVNMIDFPQLLVCMAAVVIFSLAYGWLRYNRAVGLTLLIVSLHDLLLTLGLVAIIGILVPQSSQLPVLMMLVPVFTYSQSFALLRRMVQLRTANSQRDMSNEEVSAAALKETGRQRLVGGAIALLLVLAGALSGNGLLIARLLVPLIGLAVSMFSVTMIAPNLWLLLTQRRRILPQR